MILDLIVNTISNQFWSFFSIIYILFIICHYERITSKNQKSIIQVIELAKGSG